ncbi:MAG TPA: hypothetical protein VLH18_02735 [Candidatus Limnocylindrales bacterium]|nr:hypothetical protein [Candidatus Limnocylindrales bacterium]
MIVKKGFLVRFAFIFTIALVVNLLVVYLWDLPAAGQGTFDLYRSVTIAFFTGIIVTLAYAWKRR